MMIKFIKGNILNTNADAIVHQVNRKGVMGGGLAKQIRMKYPNVYAKYRELCSQPGVISTNLLGKVQSVPVDSEKHVVNAFAQNAYGHGCRFTDYDAFRKCMNKINRVYKNKTVALPYKIGCGLGGGDWTVIFDIINQELSDCNVLIYRL